MPVVTIRIEEIDGDVVQVDVHSDELPPEPDEVRISAAYLVASMLVPHIEYVLAQVSGQSMMQRQERKALDS